MVTARSFFDVDGGPNLSLPDRNDDFNSIDRGHPITLNAFTTTHNAILTSITTIFTITIYSKEGLREVNTTYINCINHKKKNCLFYNSLHPTPMIPLNTNSTVEEADLDSSHPWVEAS